MKKLFSAIFRVIAGSSFLLVMVTHLFSQESETKAPYTEASTGNFEVVVTYNNIEPNKEANLIFYISDYKTNAPIDNANIALDIAGIDNSKIKIQPSRDPGIYEVSVEFPEIKKYNFLLSIDKDGVSDLIALNDIDIGKKEEAVVKDKESKSFVSLIHDNLFLIILSVLVLIIIAFVFYKIGRSKNTSVNSNGSQVNSEEAAI